MYTLAIMCFGGGASKQRVNAHQMCVLNVLSQLPWKSNVITDYSLKK